MHDDTHYGLEHIMSGVRLGDIAVLGRPLREYTPTEFVSFQGCLAFEAAVFEAIPIGDQLHQIISPEFHDAFYKHRTRFVELDNKQRYDLALHQRIHGLLGDDKYEVLATFQFAHVGWEMDNDYAVIRHNGEIKYVGTDHGGGRLHDRAFVEQLLVDAEQQAADVRSALSVV